MFICVYADNVEVLKILTEVAEVEFFTW